VLGTHSTSLSSLCPVHTHGPFFIHYVALCSARDTLTGLSSFYSAIRYTLTDPFFRYLFNARDTLNGPLVVVGGLFIDEVFVFFFNARDTLNGPLLSFVIRSHSSCLDRYTLTVFFFYFGDPVHSHGFFSWSARYTLTSLLVQIVFVNSSIQSTSSSLLTE